MPFQFVDIGDTTEAWLR